MDQRLDQLSAAVAQLNQPPPEPVPTPEEELGRPFIAIMNEGYYTIWLHTKISQCVTEETVQGARLAARTVLEASRGKPLPDWAVRRSPSWQRIRYIQCPPCLFGTRSAINSASTSSSSTRTPRRSIATVSPGSQGVGRA